MNPYKLFTNNRKCTVFRDSTSAIWHQQRRPDKRWCHPKNNRRGKKYVRAEILIATNIMRPNREDPSKTDFISVTHINPGGIADSRIGAKIVNKLCAKAPVNLLVALERSANSAPVPKEEAAAAKKKQKVAG